MARLFGVPSYWGSVGNRSSLLLGVCRESEFPPTGGLSGIGVPSYWGVCRESEFPPTEELNGSVLYRQKG